MQSVKEAHKKDGLEYPPRTYETIRKLFDGIDGANGVGKPSGFLTRDEWPLLAKALRAGGMPLPEEKSEDEGWQLFLPMMDKDGDGKVSLGEFCLVMVEMGTASRETYPADWAEAQKEAQTRKDREEDIAQNDEVLKKMLATVYASVPKATRLQRDCAPVYKLCSGSLQSTY